MNFNQIDYDKLTEYGLQYQDLPSSLHEMMVKFPSSTYIAQASGDSMNGVGIFDGDVLVCDRRVQPENFDVIICCYQQNFLVKILDIHNRQLLSANPSHKPLPIRESDNFNIEAVVVSSIRMFRESHLLPKI